MLTIGDAHYSAKLVSLAQTLMGKLPHTCQACVESCRVYERVETAIVQAATGKVSGPCELTAIRSELHLVKTDGAAKHVLERVSKFQELWKTEFQTWKHQDDLEDFNGLYDKYDGVRLDLIKKGDKAVEEYTFLANACHTEETQETARLQQCLLHSLTAKRMAESLLPQMKGDLLEHREDVQLIGNTATKIQENKKNVQNVLCTIAMATVLYEKPRPKTFEVVFEKTKGFMNKVNVKASDLPPCICQQVEALSKATALTTPAPSSSSGSLPTPEKVRPPSVVIDAPPKKRLRRSTTLDG